MEFIIRLIIYIVLNLVINYLFSDGGPDIPNAKPGEFDAPVVTASESIPVLFGTQIMKHPNVVWYGHVAASPWEQCT